MDEKVVIGHKNPDTDSICAALAFSRFKGDDYKAYRAGEINKETQFVLDKWNIDPPELLERFDGEDLVLVDHNHEDQAVDGFDPAGLVEIVDHHNLGGLSTSGPINVLMKPWGSTCTIIAKEFFFNSDKDLDKSTAGILLSSILSDTVIFRSVTSTEIDEEVAERLADIAGVDDLVSYGKEMFKAKSKIGDKSARDLILGDYKEFVFNGNDVGIGQVETVAIDEVRSRSSELVEEMKIVREEKGFELLILLLTDILEEDTHALVVGPDNNLGKFEDIFDVEISGNEAFLEDVMSRKRQIVPHLDKDFE